MSGWTYITNTVHVHLYCSCVQGDCVADLHHTVHVHLYCSCVQGDCVADLHHTVHVHLYCLCVQGDYVWLDPDRPGDFSVSIGAKVQLSDSGRIKVVDDDGREHWVDGKKNMRHMHATSVEGVEDMISLGDLNESGILRNLFIRYMDHLIYVSGWSLWLAVLVFRCLCLVFLCWFLSLFHSSSVLLGFL